MTTDFLSIYDAKIAEYLVAVTYLLLFVPMWRYVQGARLAEARATAGAHAAAAATKGARAVVEGRGWFHAPADVELHPGHAWARLGSDGLVTVGLDDFAQKLVAPARLRLPTTGDQVLQGAPAFAVGDQVSTVPMVSPISGAVVAVNTGAGERPETLRDAYGAGWLFKVKPSRLLEDRRGLLTGERARAWLEEAAEALAARMSPELGLVLQDGGVPVHGIAQVLAGERWTSLAQELLSPTRRTP
jgi:glycine cleavage system H lipoate-binding protein